MSFTAALVQLRASDNMEDNMRVAGGLIREAKAKGASFVALPENAVLMTSDNALKKKRAVKEEIHPAVPFFSGLAKELGVYLLAGSLGFDQGNGKIANRSLLFGPDGKKLAGYDKIHLYDAAPLPGETYKESDLIGPGDKAVLADTALGKIGLTICYDMRFPELYRTLAEAGAQIITVPSAFTVPTGKAHWHVLLRARAIETGCFILAPAQCGEHAGGRKTYGHSVIIGPWGEILAEAGEEPCVITAEIDLAKVDEAHQRIASLQHSRTFKAP